MQWPAVPCKLIPCDLYVTFSLPMTKTSFWNIKVSLWLKISNKSNLHYTRGITPRCVTSAGVHFRGLALGQQSYKETSQRWRAVDSCVSDLTDPGIKPKTSSADSDALNHWANRSENIKKSLQLNSLLLTGRSTSWWNTSQLARDDWTFIFGPVKSSTVSPTARRRCDVS